METGRAKYIEELGLQTAALGESPYVFAATATSCDGLGGRAASMQEGTDSRETDEQDWTLHILTPQRSLLLVVV